MKFKIITGLLAVIAALTYSCQSEQEIEFMRYYTGGQRIYQSKCQNCHGPQGEGLAALIPPLTDSVYLKANRAQLACYIQKGLKLPTIVNGKPFSGEMPPSNLAPVEIAGVLTYIQNSFGNNLGLHDTETVNKELAECK